MTCTNHPTSTSPVAPCSRCGRPFCEECLLDLAGGAVCASCKADSMALAESVPPPRKPNVPREQVPPWERREDLGWWPAFWQTVKGVMIDPVGFFRSMDKSVDRLEALFLYPAIALVNAAVALVFQLLGLGAVAAMLQGGGGGGQGPGAALAAQLGVQGAVGCFGVLAAPFLAFFYVIALAGAIHVALMAMKANTQSFLQTWRGCAYAWCPMAVGVIPVLGPLVGFVWMVVAQVLMTREVHGTTTGKALVAVTWLGVFCCCSLAVGAGVFAAFVAQNR